MKLILITIILAIVFVYNLTGYTYNNAPLRVESQTRKIFLKPRRRILENFSPGKEAKLKIIFEKAPNKLGIRWFYGDSSTQYLNRAEEPLKLDIKGDPRFKVDSLRSGNVLMYTLTIKKLEDKFPISITTLFNYDQALYQYLLETEVPNIIHKQDHNLASLIWMSVPHETVTINRLGEGDITIECMARIETSIPVSIGEVRIYKSELKHNMEPRGSGDQLKTIGLTKITVDRPDPFDSTSGKYAYNGSSVSEIRLGYNNTSSMRYQLMTSIKISNASEDDTGVYTCVSELVNDKIYSSSWVKIAGKSPPVMLFSSCEDSMQVDYKPGRRVIPRNHNQYDRGRYNFNSHNSVHRNQQEINHSGGNSERPKFVVSLNKGRKSCVRCSVFDSLMGTVTLMKNNEEIKESSNTTILDRHINVPEGALSELTLTFLSPSFEDTGTYQCIVQSDIEEDFVNFEVKLAKN